MMTVEEALAVLQSHGIDTAQKFDELIAASDVLRANALARLDSEET